MAALLSVACLAVGGPGRPVAAGSQLADLPLREVPARGPARCRLVVLLTGAGGWARLDRRLAGDLARAGVDVAVLRTPAYLRGGKRPERAASDLARIISEHARPGCAEPDVALVGYSMGAEIAPFLAARLEPTARRRLVAMILIGPSPTATFSYRTFDLMRPNPPGSPAVEPEIEKLAGLRIVCVYGAGEADSLCPQLAPDLARAVELPGGHHFGRRFGSLAEIVLAAFGGSTG